MRKVNFLIVVLAGMVAFSGCALQKMVKLSKDQQLEVTPDPLELHGDEVKFEMSAVLPPKMLPKGKVYTLNTFYQYGSDEVQLEAVEFKADDFPNSSTSTSRKSQDYTFAYTGPEMDAGDVQVQGVATDPRNGKNLETERLAIAKGLITTSRLVQPVYFSAYAGHGYNDQEELVPTYVDFFFDKNRSNLRTNLKVGEMTNRQRQGVLSNFIAEKNVTRTVTITGTHSPEGPERINTGLAEERPAAIEKYYRRMMGRYDYKGAADSINFVIKPVIEDWSMFKGALNEYEGLSSSEKSEILRIVNGSGSFEDKEVALQKKSYYSKIEKDIYPPLRTAKTEILTVKEKKTNAEIAVLSKQITDGQVSADTLSMEELMFSATLTPSLSEKEAIYTAATKKEPTYAAHNNLAAVYLEMAAQASDDASRNSNVEKAITQLEIAANKNQGAEALNNMAVAYMMQGNYAKAYESATQASNANPNRETLAGLKGVKGALEIRLGEYGSALSTMAGADETSDVVFNRGLALLLTKEFENAQTAFNQVIEKDADYALANYGLAVAGARRGDGEDVTFYLKKAVASDPALKERATSDLEFAKFQDQVNAAL